LVAMGHRPTLGRRSVPSRLRPPRASVHRGNYRVAASHGGLDGQRVSGHLTAHGLSGVDSAGGRLLSVSLLIRGLLA
jgi:hypothetical protein